MKVGPLTKIDTSVWPPRWTGANFKTGSTSRVQRRQKRASEKTAEDKNKGEVRRRDKKCRFPICGCRKLKILPHVAHSQHKGIGGNPAGDRSAPERMIYVCACRHRENVVSLDRGTLRWRELEKGRGAAGPVAWDIALDAIPDRLRTRRIGATPPWMKGWRELWRETSNGKGIPTDGNALEILKWLSSMEV